MLSNLITSKQIEKLEKRDRNNFAKSILYEEVCSKKIQLNDIIIGVIKKKFAACFFPIRLDKGIMNRVQGWMQELFGSSQPPKEIQDKINAYAATQ